MIVNVEFLGSEPIENVITAMNFKIDKTIFFGYEETIATQKKKTDHFLKKYCGVKESEYIAVSHTDMKSVLNIMRLKIEREKQDGNDVFFDITGGESLILVAFGIISKEQNTPMHMYDIKKNKLLEYNITADSNNSNNIKKITECVPVQHINMNIDRYIEMCGGVINYRMRREIKSLTDTAFTEKTEAMWKVVAKHASYWNAFCNVLKRLFKPDDFGDALADARMVEKFLMRNELSENSVKTLRTILDELEKAEVLRNVKYNDKEYSFSYNGAEMKSCLWDCGSILEIHTYRQFKDTSDDCRIGVHIDWDGDISEIPGEDVINEIDVLVLNGNIPSFISCKSGKMGNDKSLHALYELETVAARFGKKYAEKILVLTEPLSKTYKIRADEMGIKIIVAV